MLSTAVVDQISSYPPATILTSSQDLMPVAEILCQDLKSLIGTDEIAMKNMKEANLQDQWAIILTWGDPFLSDVKEADLDRLKSLMTHTRGLLWVTSGARSRHPAANMITGFTRTVRKEISGVRIATLDFDTVDSMTGREAAEIIMRVFKASFTSDETAAATDFEFTVIDGLIHIPRILPNQEKDRYVERETRPPVPVAQPFKQANRCLKLKLGQAGLLDSIFFVDDEIEYSSLEEDDVEIDIRATGMNFKDVMIGLGQLPLFHDLGIECSGVVTAVGSKVKTISSGDWVCGIAKGAYANKVRTSQYLVTQLMPSMDFVGAASIPVVYCTAYYALHEAARLLKGESVLIHAAAGGVGQAAVMLAQRIQAEIFVSVGTLEKKALMRDRYGIPDDHIFSSRDSSFQQELWHLTGQKGVDVVLNSTAGQTLHQSWHSLAPLGRFVEIGKRDLVLNSNLEMGKFEDAVSFSAVDIGLLAEKKPQVFKELLAKVVDLYRRGEVQAVTPISTYSISEVQQALRMMQSGKHMGKVVIEAKPESMVQVRSGGLRRRGVS